MTNRTPFWSTERGDTSSAHAPRPPAALGRLELWRLADENRRDRLGLVIDSSLWDLSSQVGDPPLASLLRLSLDRIRELVGANDTQPLPWPHPTWRSLKPIDRQEVWAAGVTYERSRDARIEESSQGHDVYARVYDAERPELFFKATPNRTVGDGEQIVIRSDSDWSVPEPELAIVVNRYLEIVGYSVGNDVTARSIEGDNPLYLPQAKIYRGSCAVGPCIVMDEALDPESGLEVALTIFRDGDVAFSGLTNTRLLRTRVSVLLDYLGRDNSFPDGLVLLTGTGVVPHREFSLHPGDLTEIAIEGVGTLRNSVLGGRGVLVVEGRSDP